MSGRFVAFIVAVVCVSCLASDVPGIRYIEGGASGEGWASRYWDCCMPHCSWPSNTGYSDSSHAATFCSVNGQILTDPNSAQSVCNGGQGAACVSQVPIVVNDNLAYAFAAVNKYNGATCGKCFDLEFTGKGKYYSDRHEPLKGKHLIVMCSNVGEDVNAKGQFDVMIPGGGVGIFNGCGNMPGWNNIAKQQFGGLLSDCEDETQSHSELKTCLTDKCQTAFSGDAQALSGCMFLAEWMNAAGNPLVTYREVECPMALKEMY